MFGLLKKIVFLPINSERTSRNSLSPLAAQNKDLDAASLFADLTLASHADVLRGSSRVSAPRSWGRKTRDEPLRTSAGEANLTLTRLRF